MSTDGFIMGAKIALIVGILLQLVPVMLFVERRGSAFMQLRQGPNRIGPLGAFQSIADVVKFFFKEDKVSTNTDAFYYVIAPLVSLIPAFMTFSVIPFASSIDIGGKVIHFQLADLNVGLLFIFSIASLGVYGIIMAGWASNNKYSLLGSLRSTSQMISYELSMGLSVIGLVMIFSSIHLGDIALGQGQILAHLGPIEIPKWGIFIQPLGFLIFLTAVFAETNRLPFDLPEGESELVAGYHLEYGAMKFALFFMAEYTNMFTASGLLATLYFGGWQIWPFQPVLTALQGVLGLSGLWAEWLRVAFEFAIFMGKVSFFMWVFVWVRWTSPRFRYDQVMDLGWRIMLPLSLLNILLTGGAIYMGWV